MADDKKKNKGGGGNSGGGSKKSNPFVGGAIVGLLLGVFVGWIIPVPSVIEQKKQQVGNQLNQKKYEMKNKAADKMEAGADKLREEEKPEDGATPAETKSTEDK